MLFFPRFHPSWPSFPGGKVDPADESVLHAALRETKEEVGIDVDKIEILGRLGPPARSLSGLRVWPYVVSFNRRIRAFPSNNLDPGVSARKPVRVDSRRRQHIATTFTSLALPDTIPNRGRRCLPSPAQSSRRSSISPRASVPQVRPILGVRRHRSRGARNRMVECRRGLYG